MTTGSKWHRLITFYVYIIENDFVIPVEKGIQEQRVIYDETRALYQEAVSDLRFD